MIPKSSKHIGIIGAGASGCLCAYFLLKAGYEVSLFDSGSPLRTLLPTGGGRCNLAFAEYDFRELTKYYPRGQKFLYSVFAKFSTYDTLSVFEELGIKTYTQENGRIFPVSNSAKEVRSKILEKIHNTDFINEKVNYVKPIENGYKLTTSSAEYFFTNIVIATGGGNKYGFLPDLKHNIVSCTPALVGLKTNLTSLSGIVLKNVYSHDCKISDDLLFTHFGISGPLIFKISSIKTKEPFPYSLSFDLYHSGINLQELLNTNPHKDLKNILSEFFPHRFAEFISGHYANTKAHLINGNVRDSISDKIHNFKLNISDTDKGEETVTAGGYNLNELSSQTLESKIYPNLYIIGEALNIDGFCGGFNLQNAWSTAYTAAQGIINS